MALKNTLTGIFSSYSDANQTVTELMNRGYTESDISVITKEDIVKGHLSAGEESKNKDGAKEGAKTGGVVGGIIGLLTGLGALAIPGIGGLFVAGPIAAALGLTGTVATTASGALTGAVAGGILGALRDAGVEEPKAKQIEERVKQGDIVIMVVPSENEESEVREIMNRNNAAEVSNLNLNLV